MPTTRSLTPTAPGPRTRNYGKTYWGVQRSTFIIDPEGTIAHVIERASPKTHDDDVLAALADTQATAT